MKWISQVWMLWLCMGFLPPVYGANQKTPVANPVAKTPGVHTSAQVSGKWNIGHHTTKPKGQSGHNMQQDHHTLAVTPSARSGSSSRVGVSTPPTKALAEKGGRKVKSGQHAPMAAPSSPSQPRAVPITTKASQERRVSHKATASLSEERASLNLARQEIQKVKALLISAHDDTLKRQKTLQAVRTTKPSLAQDVSNALKETEDIRRMLHEDIDALNKLDKAWQKDIQSANRTSKNVKPGASQS
ncbi:hypothetical protein [Candidatus Hepatobacter penaei]|uniref:hypothetical protein n=1 Tax=Candidatus Hepatobacter penaei TaxID=1274402 RepID=UPI0012E01E07|nr:hypothetical protein [Candidatus Hepatobacter penaei]